MVSQDGEVSEGQVSESHEPERTIDPHLASLEQEFRTALGTRVEVKQAAEGRGRIVIHFDSHEEFERLRAQINSWVGQMRQAA